MGRKCIYFFPEEINFAAKNISLKENRKKSYLRDEQIILRNQSSISVTGLSD
jgi:hypothetical protein